ncbi:hypothetical protein [Paraburkholderia atlantica]|nr:hypothetical protein [Paraburkholderia atlantica]
MNSELAAELADEPITLRTKRGIVISPRVIFAAAYGRVMAISRCRGGS